MWSWLLLKDSTKIMQATYHDPLSLWSDWLKDWMINGLTDWWTDWLMDWLINRPTD